MIPRGLRCRASDVTDEAPVVPLRIEVNASELSTDVAADETLLSVLRRNGLIGAKEACGRGECGACTVLVDGTPVMACVSIAQLVAGSVTTVEGLGIAGDVVRESFADHTAYQCGFCTPGHVVTATAVVTGEREPDRGTIRREISGNICRCTGYRQILDAIESARGRVGQGAQL